MELDIDSLLNSHLSSDDDEDNDNENGDLNSLHRRTVDEILNDSDSSASPPSSPPSDRRSRSSASRVSSEERPAGSRTASLARFKSAEIASSSSSPEEFFRRASKPLPSLFGGVRSNAKPGAALAAAAAASRSVPSPHAAAIKSRRDSAGSEGLRKVIDDAELGSDWNGYIGGISEEINRSIVEPVNGSDGHEKTAETLLESSVADFESDSLTRYDSTESSADQGHETEALLEVSTKPDIDIVSFNNGKDVDLGRISGAENIDVRFESNTVDEDGTGVDRNSIFMDGHEDNESGRSSSSLLATDPNRETLESTSSVDFKGENLSREDSSPNGIEEGVAGDDGSLTSDIDELLEERMGQLESKRVNEKAEKKSRPPMKRLELAEELEKKHASTGLNWEAGAAAQPMRLEGVRRGSIAVGYFDIDASNTITRTISSQAFRRDYGSPQVLAVHANYVAVGMARGVIVVVPSKYSAHNADEMDAKVCFAIFILFYFRFFSILCICILMVSP